MARKYNVACVDQELGHYWLHRSLDPRLPGFVDGIEEGCAAMTMEEINLAFPEGIPRACRRFTLPNNHREDDRAAFLERLRGDLNYITFPSWVDACNLRQVKTVSSQDFALRARIVMKRTGYIQ